MYKNLMRQLGVLIFITTSALSWAQAHKPSAPLEVGFLYVTPMTDMGWVHQHELGRQAARQLVRLTELGLLAYYERPASLIAMPSVVRKAADTGISAIFKAVDMVIHRVLAKRSLEELQSMAADMSHMIGISDHAEPRYFICFPLPAELSERASLMLARVQQAFRTAILAVRADLTLPF